MTEKKVREYTKTAKAVVGPRGVILKTKREYIEPLPPKKSAPIAFNPETGEVISKPKKPRATTRWTSESQKQFLDFIALAKLDKIMDTDTDSTMVTLKYIGVAENRWRDLWTYNNHFRKHIERLYKMGIAAWGPSFALIAHLEFETGSNQRPHWHVWISPPSGRSNYQAPSRYASEKAGVNNLVFWRWLEAAWNTILDLPFDVNDPVNTWVASAQEMRELYGQDESTPIRIARYWTKQGNSPEMTLKRKQLDPPPAWVKRGVNFRYVVSFGLELDYVEVDLSPESELALRVEVSKNIEPTHEVCGETGTIRNTSRFSPDGTQGGRHYEAMDVDQREALIALAKAP